MPLIREAIVITMDLAGTPHLAPLGLIAEERNWIIAPFYPVSYTHLTLPTIYSV